LDFHAELLVRMIDEDRSGFMLSTFRDGCRLNLPFSLR